MKLRRQALGLSLLLSSCVVSSFSIVDHLPGDDAGGSSAGSGNGGTSLGGDSVSGGSNGGSQTPGGGKPQGGQTTQGGSATQAGEPATGDAGEAAGGAGEGGAPSLPPAPKPCDAENGVAPVLCDDFEQGFDNRWSAPPGVAPETMIGPHGVNTHAAHLMNGQQLDGLLPSLGLDMANAQVTVSFWFKPVSVQNTASLVEFTSQQNVPIQLVFDVKDVHWSSQGNARAPSVSGNGNVPVAQWQCVSIYLTAGGNMKLSYFSAAAPLKVQTVVVDQTPTANVDDTWINTLPEPARTILGRPKFGAEPVNPGDVAFDDIRIIHGKTNVCGLAVQ